MSCLFIFNKNPWKNFNDLIKLIRKSGQLLVSVMQREARFSLPLTSKSPQSSGISCFCDDSQFSEFSFEKIAYGNECLNNFGSLSGAFDGNEVNTNNEQLYIYDPTRLQQKFAAYAPISFRIDKNVPQDPQRISNLTNITNMTSIAQVSNLARLAKLTPPVSRVSRLESNLTSNLTKTAPISQRLANFFHIQNQIADYFSSQIPRTCGSSSQPNNLDDTFDSVLFPNTPNEKVYPSFYTVCETPQTSPETSNVNSTFDQIRYPNQNYSNSEPEEFESVVNRHLSYQSFTRHNHTYSSFVPLQNDFDYQCNNTSFADYSDNDIDESIDSIFNNSFSEFVPIPTINNIHQNYDYENFPSVINSEPKESCQQTYATFSLYQETQAVTKNTTKTRKAAGKTKKTKNKGKGSSKNKMKTTIGASISQYSLDEDNGPPFIHYPALDAIEPAFHSDGFFFASQSSESEEFESVVHPRSAGQAERSLNSLGSSIGNRSDSPDEFASVIHSPTNTMNYNGFAPNISNNANNCLNQNNTMNMNNTMNNQTTSQMNNTINTQMNTQINTQMNTQVNTQMSTQINSQMNQQMNNQIIPHMNIEMNCNLSTSGGELFRNNSFSNLQSFDKTRNKAKNDDINISQDYAVPLFVPYKAQDRRTKQKVSGEPRKTRSKPAEKINFAATSPISSPVRTRKVSHSPSFDKAAMRKEQKPDLSYIMKDEETDVKKPVINFKKPTISSSSDSCQKNNNKCIETFEKCRSRGRR
ncbi:hypothetical protein TRFO_07002 [Tritrichomonas foetus]|uniref:Uncharacterized protein n=1 Tax=Tritrichomonas foetus TaxID=1144522 RepID=A0A1J4JV60_9EUKA|nr:hypothetical protein TRFO_07002 [Tritrichomonas foetus]|eukprot:OHT02594.1 hypothetical protein TRFO_07002 [Tritrichomonas foetus]